PAHGIHSTDPGAVFCYCSKLWAHGAHRPARLDVSNPKRLSCQEPKAEHFLEKHPFCPSLLKDYLLLFITLTPPSSQAKRVLLYLGRSQPIKTIDEIMGELQTVETLNCTIERTEAPPYYRLNSLRKAPNNAAAAAESNSHLANSKTDLSVEKGTLHTKRHSTEDPIRDK
ncbi:GD12904, partial [Caligus rogercresseyi]